MLARFEEELPGPINMTLGCKENDTIVDKNNRLYSVFDNFSDFLNWLVYNSME